MLRNVALTHLLFGLALIGLAPRVGNAQNPAPSERYIEVDGWAVIGYANGRELGYDWYQDKGKALEAKAKMEQVQTTTGKYYDKVEIQPEKRRIPINRSTSPARPPEITMPQAPRLGGGTNSQPKPTSLGGTTWVGSESASDTTNLKFVFAANGRVTAYDDSRSVWSGTWRMIGQTTVVIQLTSPNAVNYSGQINGNSISGKAGRPGGRGQWSWSVRLSN